MHLPFDDMVLNILYTGVIVLRARKFNKSSCASLSPGAYFIYSTKLTVSRREKRRLVFRTYADTPPVNFLIPPST